MFLSICILPWSVGRPSSSSNQRRAWQIQFLRRPGRHITYMVILHQNTLSSLTNATVSASELPFRSESSARPWLDYECERYEGLRACMPKVRVLPELSFMRPLLVCLSVGERPPAEVQCSKDQ